MKALHFFEHGPIENLVYGELPDPSPKPGEALIRVEACAMNHLDLWILGGWPGLKLEMPHIGGADIAGTVVQAANWKEGDRVVAYPGLIGPADEWTKRGEESVSPNYHIIGENCRGGFAEYVSVPEENLYPMPEGVSFSQAAAPLLVGLTAWRMLVQRARLQTGQTVLIVGAGGGVNSFSISLASALGAKVYALTSSEEKMQKAKELGASEVINYRKTSDWSREINRLTDGRGVDIVVDNVGEKTMNESIKAARRGGCIVTVGNTSGPALTVDNRHIFTKQLSLLGSTMGSKKDFEDVLKLIWSKKIAPVIDSTLPLSEGKNAYRMLEKGSQFGKVVLTP